MKFTKNNAFVRNKARLMKMCESGKHDLRNLIFTFKYDFDLKSYEKAMQDIKVLNANKERLFANPLPKTYLDIRSSEILPYSASLKVELDWCVFSILQHKEELIQFLKLKSIFEHALISGDYGQAQSTLDYINSNVGHSIWSLESKFILNEFTGGITKNLEFLTELCTDGTDVILLLLSDFYSRKCEKNITVGKLNEYYHQILHSASADLTNYFYFKLNHARLKDIDVAFSIYLESISSVVDRYLMLIEITKYSISRNLPEASTLVNCIKDNFKEFPDPSLKAITNVSNLKKNKFKDCSSSFRRDEICMCIDTYKSGDYIGCIDQAGNILKADATVFEIYQYYIKSHINIGRELVVPFSEDSIGHDVMCAIDSVYMFDADTSESLGKLIKIYITLGNSNFAHQIVGYLSRYIKMKNCDHYIVSAVASSRYQLAFLELLHINDQSVAIIQSLVRDFSPGGVAFINYAIKNHYQENIRHLNEPYLIECSILRARYLISTGEIEEATELLKKLILVEIPIYLLTETITLLFDLYISTGDVKDATRLVVDSFVVNNNYIKTLKLGGLRKEILDSDAIDFISSKEDIYTVILISILEKEKLLVKDEGFLHVAFANYLNALDVKKPSELLQRGFHVDTVLVVYFLYQVCQLDVLDYLSCFSGTEELENERISIFQMLRVIDPESKKKYDEEISALTQQITIRKRIQQVDEGKITVDTAGIISTSNDTVAQLYSRYRSLDSISNDAIKLVDNAYIASLLSNMDAAKQEKPKVVFVRDPKYKLFKELFYDIRDRFVFNNEYGLDSNLSVRIRHGTLKGELRRPFSECRLLTTKNKESGVYYENAFWKERLQTLDATVLEGIMQLLTEFSAEIDEIISDVPSKWIQVKTESKGLYGVFDYTYKDYDLAPLYLTANELDSLEDLLGMVLKELWRRTEENLQNIRGKMNGELKETLIYYLNNLEKSIRQLAGVTNDYFLKSLINCISTCRTNMQSDINNVIKWFSISDNKSIIDFSMTELVDTCLQIVKKIYPNVNIKMNCEINDEYIYPGHVFEALVMVLLNLLDNACKYANFSDRVNAELTISTDKNVRTFIIQNKIQDDVDIEELKSIIANIQHNIDNNNVADALRKEGRTGFYKMHNILNTALKCSYSNIKITISPDKIFKVVLSAEL
ncbi:ATP-binding protein [Geomonas azotofigens]|uniref:hypothetical protein n=1 Tax=Geomonas azotofigens TaxID=2843196 RepID=UPI001C110013|nr:hypothetical protein [Geomonas azotofigens]MBU5611677.1 hypothetical protein [Geomonas azotofigens]